MRNLAAALAGAACVLLAVVEGHEVVRAGELDAVWESTVPCATEYAGEVAGCRPTTCWRRVVDGFASTQEVDALRAIADKGMQQNTLPGGPVIMDINTGFVMDAGGLQNIYRRKPGVAFSADEYDLYRGMVLRIRDEVKRAYGLEQLYLTAPTFITRIRGDPAWQPATPHDEYYHYHVDKNNTEHYDYSGLLYLSTGGGEGEDFSGGVFDFNDSPSAQALAPTHASYDGAAEAAYYAGDAADTASLATSHPGSQHASDVTYVVPRRGRLITFTSGAENLHRVARVTQGERLVLSLWFTCDPAFEFKAFLDGNPHEQAVGQRSRAGKQRRRRRRVTRQGDSRSDSHRSEL